MANLSDEREGRKNNKASALPQQASRGWTLQQLAVVLMIHGVIAVVVALKCLLFGPPPYSVLAYFIGPCLILASYLVDPHAIADLVTEVLNSPRSPAAKRE
jgi:Flp pilus assembly protein TadB